MKKNFFSNILFLLVLALGLVFASPARATVIANYTFTTNSFASFDTDLNSVANPIGVTNLPTSSFVTSGGSVAYDFSSGTSMNTSSFLQFTVTANSGFYISLVGGSLTNSICISSTSGTKTAFWAVSSSVLGFGTIINSGSTQSGSFVSIGTGTLNGSQYDNLSSITFRIYGWTDSASKDVIIDNINLAGTLVVSPVPEPGTCALAAMGVALLGGRFVRSYKNRNRK